jgi:phasin family protein
MSDKPEQLSQIHRKNMEAAMRLAQLSIDNSQRIMQLQTGLAKQLFDESVANAQALSSVQDPQQIITLRTQYAQETSKQMMAAAQQIAEIGNQARSEFSRLLTEQLASGSEELMESFQSFFKAVPGQNPNLMETLQQAMSTANGAFEQIAKASSAAFAGSGNTATKGSAKSK